MTSMFDRLLAAWDGLRAWVRAGLIRWRFVSSGPGRRVSLHEEQPSDRFVLSIALMIIFFCGLCALEVVHMIVFREWNDAVFNGVMLIIGSLVGCLFGYREAPE